MDSSVNSKKRFVVEIAQDGNSSSKRSYGWDTTEPGAVHWETVRHSREQTYRNFTVAAQVFIFFGSLVGNGLVLWSTCRPSSLRTVTARLVRNLACAGVCACLVCVPCDIALSAGSQGCWHLLPLRLCHVLKFLHKLFCSVTILTFAAIAMDRYYSILYPLERKISDTRSRDLLVYIWAHGVVASAPVFAVSGVADVYAVSTCADSQAPPSSSPSPSSPSPGRLAYAVAYALTTVALPLAAVVLFLALIRRALGASREKASVVAALRTPRVARPVPYVSRREAELHATLLGMVATFAACGCVPYAALLAHRCVTLANAPVALLLTAAWLPKVSLLANPLLFLALSRAARGCLVGVATRLHRRCCRYYYYGGGGAGATRSAAQVAPVSGPEGVGGAMGGPVGCGPFELPPQWLSDTKSSKRRLLPPLGTTPEQLIQSQQPRAQPEGRMGRNNRVSTFSPAEP
ncbi:hypothetical protein AAFF_G00247920 [Aldrovandia affinis]|uniref:G-protein coupled receptors family 1 profile domain-containing protein n=1 Tax=Aldrovandia affinis TaxID=143900 RepID=A0AAD7W2V8_9TELE|nr:hypothetical protein AAFF_G00247920 [Aldrovandia affinis]